MPVWTAAVRATLVELRCPHCGASQMRARKPRGSVYACKQCHKRFTRGQTARAK